MISVAIKEAKKSSCRYQHGAVVCKGSRQFGKGHNSYKTHPRWGGGPLNTVHAEASAIRDTVRRGINLRNTTIYVVRYSNKNSKPCKSCKKLIQKYGIRKVVYTDINGNIVTEWPS